MGKIRKFLFKPSLYWRDYMIKILSMPVKACNVTKKDDLSSDIVFPYVVFPHVIEARFGTDGTEYLSDFLSRIPLPLTTTLESLSRVDSHFTLRHDVDWSIENALIMGNIERKSGVRSSYFLLHPDGHTKKDNYFGSVENGKLLIRESLFEAARRLIDMGHEVGLHNDLLSLSLTTGIHPRIYLEQIVEAFAAQSIPILGSVAHGSPLCRKYGFINYQIFSEAEGYHYADVFKSDVVEHEGFYFKKYTLKMSDFGLVYEANFPPYGVDISDSGAKWRVGHYKTGTKEIEKSSPKGDFLSNLDDISSLVGEDIVSGDVIMYNAHMLTSEQRKKKTFIGRILIHADHWNFEINMNKNVSKSKVTDKLLKRQTEIISNRNLKTKNSIFASNSESTKPWECSSVLWVSNNINFSSYNKSYRENKEHFVLPKSVEAFSKSVIDSLVSPPRIILELGAGQGAFLGAVQKISSHAWPEHPPVCLGIDGSVDGISCCASNYPDCFWVGDTVQSFLEKWLSPTFSDKYPEWVGDNVQIVLDKTGTTLCFDYPKAVDFIKKIHSILDDGGIYIYIASRNFYENKLMAVTYKDWPIGGWMALLEQEFGNVQIYDDEFPDLKGYHKRVFTKK